jgi:hypothetical protein
VRQERLARSGQRHRAAVAMKERLAELALQATDLRADRRLGDRHAIGGARELRLLGHRDEVGELPKIHNESLCKA